MRPDDLFVAVLTPVGLNSEGGMMRLEILIELKFLNSSFSSLFSC